MNELSDLVSEEKNPIPFAFIVDSINLLPIDKRIYILNVKIHKMKYDINNIIDIIWQIDKLGLSELDRGKIINKIAENNKSSNAVNNSPTVNIALGNHKFANKDLFYIRSNLLFKNVNPSSSKQVFQFLIENDNIFKQSFSEFSKMKDYIHINPNMCEQFKQTWIKKINNFIILQ